MIIFQFFELVLHIDKYLQILVNEYSVAVYVILFLIIFFETGIVISPFLPGDSLLFAAGALAATGSLEIGLLFFVVFLASVLGDTVNYHIGKFIGPRIFTKESSWFFNRNYLVRAQHFYEKNGKKTIILARFIPIIRTFAPFVAGIGTMSYLVFLGYNIIGAVLWSSLFIFGGFWFGNIPIVKDNFGLFVIGVIIISLIPLVKEILALIKEKKNN
ncbi:MAG: DedA family protein [Candidatus Buchananbacteria bacterium]|nr:DedA family protein [Candidatus Buchananbacteria bacterium]